MGIINRAWWVRSIIRVLQHIVDVSDSARRFFQSKQEESALKRTGKYATKVTQQRRRNRITRVSVYLIYLTTKNGSEI